MRTGQRCGVSLTRLCSLSGYTPQAYYKQQRSKEQEQFQEGLIISQVIAYRRVQPRLGCRKLLLLLGPFIRQHHLSIGRDAFIELLRQHQLLVVKRRRRKPQTTFSQHWMRKHPNLIENLTPIKAGGLWVSDITYIELSGGNGYLSLVTDAYSRKIVGYHLSGQLTAAGPVSALQMAIAGCADTGSLIHHSDRGSQYCSNDYVGLLHENNISISMTQSGDPRDNAIAERVNGILKNELLINVFEDMEQAQSAVMQAVRTYNYLRPHSSIDMLTPAFAHSGTGRLKRHWKARRYARPVMDG